ncbi:MAG: hypothetical protein AAF926_00590 [Pseudomonadota bacterium]
MDINATHKWPRHAGLCAATALLVACATATPYQPASEPGAFDGFSQQMIEADRARISFAGNSLTKRDTVENYLLYRAAETALERGYDWFELVERDTEAKTRTRVTPGVGSFYDPYFGYSFYRPRFGWSRGYRYSAFRGFRHRRGFGFRGFYDPFYDPFFNDFDVREITKYRATAEVRFGNGSRPDGRTNAFDARSVIENIGPTIKLPEVES